MAEEYPGVKMEGSFQQTQDQFAEVEAPRENWFFSWLKSLIVFLLLVGVVAASFWVSFQLGRRILVPAKKLPGPNVEAVIPEPPPSLKALQKLEAALSEETAKEERQVAAPKRAARLPSVYRASAVPKRTVAPRKTAVPKKKKVTVQLAGSKHYYKVQAGTFGEKAEAQELAQQMKNNGFDVYVKRISDGWRVQVGAYVAKGPAALAQEQLSEKGFKTELLYE